MILSLKKDLVSKRKRAECHNHFKKFQGGCGFLASPAGFQPVIKARSIVRIDNLDGMCLMRSVVVCLFASMYGTNSTKYKQIEKNIYNKQTIAALRLLKLAKITIGLNAYNLKHASKIQKFLDRVLPGQCRIIIFDGNGFFKCVFKGAMPAKHELPILLHNGHFQPVLRPKELFRVNFLFF